MVTKILIFLSLIGVVIGSYCGQSAIPFSFETGPDGQPVLGCARPSCFGWTAEGKRAADSAQFYKINKKPDGFLRSSDGQGPKVSNVTGFKPQYAFCDRTYMWNKCLGANQWVGGIAPLAKISSDSMFQVMCCTYDQLSTATDQGVAEVRVGQAVVGGEIKGDDGRQYSFEYISNVERNFDENGVVYQVTMKRFPCVPEPLYDEADVEAGAADVLMDNINKQKENKAENVQFGSKNVDVDAPIRSFEQTKFDLPKDMPHEQGQIDSDSNVKPLVEFSQQAAATAAPAPASSNQQYPGSVPSLIPGYRMLPTGQLVPCAKNFEDVQPQQQQQQPVVIPENTLPPTTTAAATLLPATAPPQYTQAYYQPQQQQQQYFQPNPLDPLGIFQQQQQRAYAVPSVQQQQSIQIPSPSYPPQQQSIPQPNYSYNPFWPFYSYSQNPAAQYGVQTQVQTAPSQPLAAPQFPIHGTRSVQPAPRPKPIPLKIPSVDEVEQFIPESGKKMIYNVARTLLGI